jgi:cell division septum initiation protein DivIVA
MGLDLRDWGDRPQSGQAPPRFPIASQGYDRAIVDQRFAELEQELSELDRELAQLEASTPPRTEAGVKSDRIGEQISSILIAAHESAEETKRLADGEAERRIADAERRARALTEDANQELGRLQNEIGSLLHERDRLIYDIRTLADGLRALADNPSEDTLGPSAG